VFVRGLQMHCSLDSSFLTMKEAYDFYKTVDF
jgi:hypothetical protein